MCYFSFLGGELMNEQINNYDYKMTVNNREEVSLNGVLNVSSFGEDFLSLNTSLGEVIIEGTDLKIESLTKENGEILIIGKINGIIYKDKKDEKGFFGKLFK